MPIISSIHIEPIVINHSKYPLSFGDLRSALAASPVNNPYAPFYNSFIQFFLINGLSCAVGCPYNFPFNSSSIVSCSCFDDFCCVIFEKNIFAKDYVIEFGNDVSFTYSSRYDIVGNISGSNLDVIKPLLVSTSLAHIILNRVNLAGSKP